MLTHFVGSYNFTAPER